MRITTASVTEEDEEEEVPMGCLHMGCRCDVSEGQEYCSDYCREHAAEADHAAHECACGHPACQMQGV